MSVQRDSNVAHEECKNSRFSRFQELDFCSLERTKEKKRREEKERKKECGCPLNLLIECSIVRIRWLLNKKKKINLNFLQKSNVLTEPKQIK
jgi:hypothetical protein